LTRVRYSLPSKALEVFARYVHEDRQARSHRDEDRVEPLAQFREGV